MLHPNAAEAPPRPPPTAPPPHPAPKSPQPGHQAPRLPPTEFYAVVAAASDLVLHLHTPTHHDTHKTPR
ncbi:hypothetical protein GB937_000265 [Aspergillus fischeri]|nr:hypothetical protein GB937_000265 [Aspergillus fischeri]